MDVTTTTASIGLMEAILSVTFLASVIRVCTPILYAALGSLIATRANVMNIALEGTMLFSSMTGVLASGFLLQAGLPEVPALLLAMVVGILTGCFFAFVLSYFAIKLKANLTLTGLALNLFATGGTLFFMEVLIGEKGNTASMKSLSFPALNLFQGVPGLETVFNQNILTYLAFVMVFVVYLFMFKTPMGLKIRAVGEQPNAAESVGIKVNRIRYIAVYLSCAFASVGGMFMSMGYTNLFVRNNIAGRGFIAMSASNLGRAHPIGAMLASLVFATADALTYLLQNYQMIVEFVQMVPYVATLLALFLYSIMHERKLNKIRAQR